MLIQKTITKSFFSKLKIFFFLGAFLCFTNGSALAQVITAIDFNGDIIGSVIPDGKVVSLDNKLIGNINADSLIVNFESDLIGGVVPQGIAIGNDNRFLGKVSSDGSVRLASGKIAGKSLPNGLVVDEFYEVIGAVLSPGLIYSGSGEIIGRLIGDGSYVNLQGQKIGFVTSDGFAYRQIGTDFSIAGKLISSKMVVSNDGKFIGSVSPNGKVTNFEGELIGRLKANSFVYDNINKIIGKTVSSGYAFENSGKYLGFVTYNGEVLYKEELKGYILPNGDIQGLDGEIIGFFMDFATTFVSNTGTYMGRLLPNGLVLKAKNIVGSVTARGLVVDNEKNIIGQKVENGAVFDYKGTVIAHALKNGSAVLLNGSPYGHVKGSFVYDKTGKITGSTKNNVLVMNFNNDSLGARGIDSLVGDKGVENIVSPFGYVFSSEGVLSGSSLEISSIYNLLGNKVANISPNGEVFSKGSLYTGKLTSIGIQLDERNRILGKSIPVQYFSSNLGTKLGALSNDNKLLDDSGKVFAKVLYDGNIVKTEGDSINYIAKLGEAYNQNMVLNIRGNLVGYADVNGIVRDFSDYIIGQVVERGIVLDNNSAFIGEVVGYQTALDNTCNFLGVMSPNGEVRNFRDVYIGKPLLNGQVISDNGASIGYLSDFGSVFDNLGNIVGVAGYDSKVINYAGESLGCLDFRGQLLSDNKIIGEISKPNSSISFGGELLGRTTLLGSIIDSKNSDIGYIQPKGNVSSKTGVPIGNLFKYKYAFNYDNKLAGIVLSDFSVYGLKDKQIIGKVNFDGEVIFNKTPVGYALYDLYVYDSSYKAVGYIAPDGRALSFMGQNFGRMDKGFVSDPAGKILARGNRDYIIRSATYDVLGELDLDGSLMDLSGKLLGKLDIKDGRVVGEKGEYLASAHQLQYYGKLQSTKPVYSQTGDVVGYANDDGSVVNEDGKIIALLDENGLAISANGDIIGGIGANWLERSKEVRGKDYTLPEIGTLDPHLKEQSQKSLAIALNPDGDFLGYIQNDGRVSDKDGNYLGRKMPDGLVMDDEGNLIGTEDKGKGVGGDIFIPGTVGQGGAYGTGVGAGNLGPGGGYGPGERYDPNRAGALNQAQAQRRGSMEVGKISTTVNKNSFDGMQKNWDEQGIGKAISSWRVDLSEMILADKPIPAVISRSIDSNNPTPITAYVERNVYAEEGRNVIIPAGSRIIGTLGSLVASTEVTSQSAKVSITWERLIRPDGSIFIFQGITGDAQGRGGALGYLDQQLFKKYTLPVVTTVLTSATTYMMAENKDIGGETETPKQQAANDARQNFMQSMNSIFEQILQDKTNIRPLTYVPAGTRIIVYPNVDLWLRTAEREELEATSDFNKRDILIDDKEVKQERETDELKRKMGVDDQRGSGSGSGAEILYEPDGEVYDAPLISDRSLAERQAQDRKASLDARKAGAGAPPPPPPSSSSLLKGSSSSSSSTPQLF